ncbi:tyrosine-type recombinase/integrase [Halotalea alkalilenta]|uniref:tyrosine-type recombinase/integrase n=1 Tax=Halotalea alkalilenta TaxID=376489 RepID=UPI000A8796DC
MTEPRGEVALRLPLEATGTGLMRPAPAGARIDAEHDVAAVGLWLAEYRLSPRTQRHYRKEAERLLLWLADHGLGLAELDRRRLADFEAFLADPRPSERWIGPTRRRSDPDWRPFRGPLGAASRRQSLVILQGMFAWLQEAGWVAHNPFRLVRDKGRRLDNRQGRVERYLERPLWNWLWHWIDQRAAAAPPGRPRFEAQRIRFVFAFAYLLAPRISEIAAARMSDFRLREGHWWWEVTGKGDKRAALPVPDEMLEALAVWRGELGLAAQPGAFEHQPLLRGLDGERPLGDNQLYRLIKAVFLAAAQALERRGDARPEQLAALRAATPHWLRHTSLTHQAQHGVELRYLAQSARHARIDTTARYLHTEAEEWQRQVAGHRLEPSG